MRSHLGDLNDSSWRGCGRSLSNAEFKWFRFLKSRNHIYVARVSLVGKAKLFLALENGVHERRRPGTARELPMEFAVEAKALLEVSLEGAVG